MRTSENTAKPIPGSQSCRKNGRSLHHHQDNRRKCRAMHEAGLATGCSRGSCFTSPCTCRSAPQGCFLRRAGFLRDNGVCVEVTALSPSGTGLPQVAAIRLPASTQASTRHAINLWHRPTRSSLSLARTGSRHPQATPPLGTCAEITKEALKPKGNCWCVWDQSYIAPDLFLP